MKTWLAIACVVLGTACKGGDKAADKPGDKATDKGGAADYEHKAKATEAKMMLNLIGKLSKRLVGENSQFAVGQAGPTPATPCCQGPDHKCAVTKDWASSPVWSALEFHVDEPGRFQYSYTGDGKTFTATAVGDLDCDGHPVTYTVRGTIDPNGMPTIDLRQP